MKSAVATVDGLDVTFEDDGGQLGAVRLPYASQQAAGQRQRLVLGALSTYFVEPVVLRQTNANVIVGTSILFNQPQHVALNLAQGMQAESPPSICYRLWRSNVTKETYFQTMDLEAALKQQLIWDGCPSGLAHRWKSPPGELSGQS